MGRLNRDLKNESPEQLNHEYFKALIATRSSLGMLGIAFAGIFIGAIVTAIFWGTGQTYHRNEPFEPFTLVALFGTLFMVASELVIVLNPLRQVFYLFQKFSSLWQVFFVFELMVLLVMMTTLQFFSGLHHGMPFDIYREPYLLPYLLVIALIYGSAVVYNVFG